jgi:zinc protease
VGRQGPKASDPAYYPAIVANTIFGGAFGSRLTKNIREDKGYTYSPGSSVGARERGGLLRVRADVRNEVTGPTLMEMFYELDRMGATKPTDEEVTTAKRYQSGLYLLRNQIQGAVAGLLANNWVNGLPSSALGEFVPKVQAVTVPEIQKAGQALFASENQTVVVVGDAGKVKAEVAQFGTVKDFKP